MIDILKKKYKKYIKHKEFDFMLISLVRQFIQRKNLVIYGGLAIHLLLREEGHEGIYDDNDIPDYDVFSEKYEEDALEFAKMINKKYSYGKIRIVTGITGKTRRIFIGLGDEARLDISFKSKKDIEKIQTKMIGPYTVCGPHFLKIDQYQNLCINLFKDMFRMNKTFKRVRLLEKYFPLIPGKVDESEDEEHEDIGMSLSEITAKEDVILGGDYVFSIYYGGEKKGEIIVYSNSLFPGKVLGITGELYSPNYRVLPLYGEFFYRKKGKVKIATRMTLLYQYYHLRFHTGSHKYDKKIVTLVNDPATWEIYLDPKVKKFPEILIHSTEKVKAPIKFLGTVYID